MKIRKYQVTDKQNLQNICIITANPQKNKQAEALLTILYNDYYTECEPQSCFVLVNDDDNAVGYIICAKDYSVYKKIFKEKYLPIIKSLSYIQYLLRKAEFCIENHLSKQYPAHLHIDIMPCYTGKGSGSMLMNALLDYLKSENIKGVMLGVGIDNKKAVNFYQKFGFNKLLKFGAIFMGKKL